MSIIIRAPGKLGPSETDRQAGGKRGRRKGEYDRITYTDEMAASSPVNAENHRADRAVFAFDECHKRLVMLALTWSTATLTVVYDCLFTRAGSGLLCPHVHPIFGAS